MNTFCKPQSLSLVNNGSRILFNHTWDVYFYPQYTRYYIIPLINGLGVQIADWTVCLVFTQAVDGVN